jgi:hypothetical protein
MRSYPSWIAGLKHRAPDGTDRARYCARYLKPGMFLKLVPEPDNRHSDTAVAVRHGRCHLGYIPERHDWVFASLDDGETLACMVMEVQIKGWFFKRAKTVKLQIGIADRATQALAKSATRNSDTPGKFPETFSVRPRRGTPRHDRS